MDINIPQNLPILSEQTKDMLGAFCVGAHCTIYERISAQSFDLELIIEKQGVHKSCFVNEETAWSEILATLEKLLDEVDFELENRRYINDHIRQTDKCRS